MAMTSMELALKRAELFRTGPRNIMAAVRRSNHSRILDDAPEDNHDVQSPWKDPGVWNFVIAP